MARTSPPWRLARRGGLRHGWDMARRRFSFAMLARGLVFAALALIVVFAALVAIYAVARPVSTLMLGRMAVGKSYERTYVRLADIAPVAVA